MSERCMHGEHLFPIEFLEFCEWMRIFFACVKQLRKTPYCKQYKTTRIKYAEQTLTVKQETAKIIKIGERETSKKDRNNREIRGLVKRSRIRTCTILEESSNRFQVQLVDF